VKTHLDLFSGIGGFALAAQWAGYTTVAFCEKEPYAQQILKERFGAVLADAAELQRNGSEHHAGGDSQMRRQVSKSGNGCCPRLHPDIFTLNGADYAGVDLLTGGFPCQPFSVAGKRRGKEDDRALWPEMLRVIAEAKPRWILGENVAGIVTMELDNILSDLEAIGYSAWPLVIPACAVDAKHRRDRVWILGHSSSAGCEAQRNQSIGSESRSRQSEITSPSDVAHTENRNGRSGISTAQEGIGEDGERRRGLAGGGKDVADADEPRPQGRHGAELRECGCKRIAGQGYSRQGEPCSWLPEPELGRVAHGVPHRSHRLRGLGNAIVPQVAYEIIRQMT